VASERVLINIEVKRDDDLTTIARLHFREQLFGEEFRVDLKIGLTRGRSEIDSFPKTVLNEQAVITVWTRQVSFTSARKTLL